MLYHVNQANKLILVLKIVLWSRFIFKKMTRYRFADKKQSEHVTPKLEKPKSSQLLELSTLKSEVKSK